MKPLIGAALAVVLTAASGAAVLAPPAPARAEARAVPKRGDYLPQDLLAAGPTVDVKAARLRRPPAGYGWYSLGAIYVLASVMTGLIVEVVAP